MKTTFAIRPFEARSIAWWNTQRDNIDMNPIYQRRGGLWSKEDKAYLIDSVLNEFDIPKLYIADFTYIDTTLNEKKKQFAIVDGKQRFEAIYDFYDGKIVLNDDFTYIADPLISLAGLGYKDLKNKHSTIAEKFDQFSLAVVSVITNDDSKINELFVRLNRNKPLTGAEIRNAMRGQVPKLIRELAQHPFFSNKIRFQIKRGGDKNTAAKLLITEYLGQFTDVKRVQLDRFVEEGTRVQNSDLQNSYKRAVTVLDNMNELFMPKDHLLAAQGQLPVYYWFVRTLFERYGDDIRPFLNDFERRRKESRSFGQRQKGSPFEDYLAYNAFNRNVNDAGSLFGRHKILVSEFKRYLSKQ